MMRIIYKITNKINNKCYIGKSEDAAQRIKYHMKSLKGGWNKNKHLQSAVNKYGLENFYLEVLENVDENEDINEREKFYINLYKTYDPKYGYNRTLGGDGGNSYVDCMTEEELAEHWKKHKELRTGKNNHVYGKKLYHKGAIQKYLSDNEIEDYIKDGWEKGATKYFKQQCSERMKGENNPFYGKKHSKETIDKINEANKINQKKKGKTYVYHKGNEQKVITKNEIEQYEKNGWVHGLSDLSKQKMIQTKKEHPTKHNWSNEQRQEMLTHYVYDEKDFYGKPELISYLHQQGYIKIGINGIDSIMKKHFSKFYPELIGKIQIINKEEKENA